MARGDFRAPQLTGNANSITNPMVAGPGPVTVNVGDLIFVLIGEQMSGATLDTCTDNLGNVYAGLSSGSTSTFTFRPFYSRATVAGSLTSVNASAVPSANNAAIVAAVFEGPFLDPPLDKAPGNITNDIASPFSCPASGVLVQADELVVCWAGSSGSATWSVGAPLVLRAQQATAAILSVRIASKTVAATTSTGGDYTGTNPTAAVLGTATFKLAPPTGYTETIEPGAVPIAGATVVDRFGRRDTATAGAVPIAGANVGDVLARVAPAIAAAAVPIAGQNVPTPYTDAIQLGAIPITGATITPVYAGTATPARSLVSWIEVEAAAAAGVGYTITIQPGAVPIAGASVVDRAAYLEAITPAAMPIAGASITPVFSAGGISYSTPVTAGAVPLTGANVGVRAAHRETIAPATVPLTGLAVSPIYSVAGVLTIQPGAVPLTGASVGEVFARIEPAIAAGAVPITGQAVTPLRASADTITAAAVPIAGATILPLAAYRESLVAGGLPLTGQAVGAVKASSDTITAGSLPLTGQTLTLRATFGETITAAAVPITGAEILPVVRLGLQRYPTTLRTRSSNIPTALRPEMVSSRRRRAALG